MKVLLFDIDGTLILTGGAGLRAMNKAFEKIFGIRDGLANLSLAGRTDTSIIREALTRHDLPHDERTIEKFKQTYYAFLQDEIAAPLDGKRIMPGVMPLLRELSRRENIYLGLLTGNWEKSGRLKLAYFGLNDYFPFGAFADDSPLRDELLPFAIERFTRQYGLKPDPADVYVIGDTPSDIQCARPHGAKAVAIGASIYSVEQLKAHQPDFLFENLANTDEVLKVLG